MRRRTSRRDLTSRAEEVTREAERTEDPGALEVAADAWEEAGDLKRAGRLRARANEVLVREAASRLEYALEELARRSGDPEFARVEPRGDYYVSEVDPQSRSRAVIIRVPYSAGPYDDKRQMFETLIGKGSHGWIASYGIGRHRALRWSATHRFSSPKVMIASLTRLFGRAIRAARRST